MFSGGLEILVGGRHDLPGIGARVVGHVVVGVGGSNSNQIGSSQLDCFKYFMCL
jgi:hypothetical protein